MREIVRLHPAGVLSPRQATIDVAIGSHTIRKGTLILWSAHLAGRNPTAWPDPLRFDPDRFVGLEPEQQSLAGLQRSGGSGPACVKCSAARVRGGSSDSAKACKHGHSWTWTFVQVRGRIAHNGDLRRCGQKTVRTRPRERRGADRGAGSTPAETRPPTLRAGSADGHATTPRQTSALKTGRSDVEHRNARQRGCSQRLIAALRGFRRGPERPQRHRARSTVRRCNRWRDGSVRSSAVGFLTTHATRAGHVHLEFGENQVARVDVTFLSGRLCPWSSVSDETGWRDVR